MLLSRDSSTINMPTAIRGTLGTNGKFSLGITDELGGIYLLEASEVGLRMLKYANSNWSVIWSK